LNRTVRAGANGNFAFTQIPAGHYLMVARRKGYIERMYLQHEQFTSAIEVGPNLNSENLVYPLPPQCVLSGQVTDELGDPVEGAKALLLVVSTEDGRNENRLKSRKIADEEGRYRFEALPAGDYYLAISADPWYAQAARWGGVFQSAFDSDGEKPKGNGDALD